MTKSQIALEYRQKYGMDMPSLKLARIMYKECPTAFLNLEQARGVLRYIEGKSGATHRKVRNMKIPDRPHNPYKIPESHTEKNEPYILPVLSNNILFISDLHIPYHDIDAVNAAIEYGIKEKVNTIFINGDLMDFYQLSRFEKDPRKRGVKTEFDTTKQFFVSLRAAFPQASIYWLYGNHDIRYEKWLMTKAHEIFDDPYYHLDARLSLNNYNVITIDDKRLVKAGKLSITHGHHVLRGFFSPVNSARGVYMRAKQSTIISHVHKVSTHSETDMDGTVVTTWSTGCLCDLKPDYSPLVSNYQHGFAHITTEPSGDYYVRNYQIINGKLY